MHEISLAGSVINLIEAAAAREGFSRVRQVRCEIGELACVEADALRTAFAAASKESCAAGAQLEIITIAGEGVCPQCRVPVPMPSLYELCPLCGERPLEVRCGTEMRVKDLVVE